MKAYHFSDNHGRITSLKRIKLERGLPELWIGTGDFCPDTFFSLSCSLDQKRAGQERWIRANSELLKETFEDVPLMIIEGNHDFVALAPALIDIGLNVIDPTKGLVHFGGLTFTGFPQVPSINGWWNHECEYDKLEKITNAALDLCPDVLLCHAPPAGILDYIDYGGNVGNRPLYTRLAYWGKKNPRWVLFGHIHEHGGRQESVDGTIFVNAATRVVELQLDNVVSGEE